MQAAKSIIIALFLLIYTMVQAQKLPNVQNNSLPAPANIKIDGKADEWNNQFQAFNHATDVFYSIANDDHNIYLVVQATRSEIINKLLLGGISLIINTSGEKSDRSGLVIAYPTAYKNKRVSVNFKNFEEISADPAKVDSFMRAANAQIADKLREIEIEGIKGIDDSLLSVYNSEGIKAASLFNRQMYYTIELAIPRKYINPEAGWQFNYNIRLNGAMSSKATIKLLPRGNFYLVTNNYGSEYVVPASAKYLNYTIPTDFWGKYALINK